MEPITVIVSGGVCLTGALLATWKLFHRPSRSGEIPDHSPVHSNVVSFPPRISYGFSTGRSADPQDILVGTLREATHALDVGIGAFTDLDIALEVIQAHRRGVNVRIITDTELYKRVDYQHRIVSELVAEGISIKMNVQEDAPVHLSMIVVDSKTVIVGSFNFKLDLTDKREEVLVRIDDVTIAKDWHRHFDYMWNDRKRYALHKDSMEKRYA